MNILQFAVAYWYVTVPSLGALALFGINYSAIMGSVRKAKPRSVPARNIDDLAKEMLAEACKLPADERDETNKLIDGIRRVTERSMMEPDDPIVAAAKRTY